MSDAGSDLQRALPETRWSRRLDRVVVRVGDACAWIWLVLLGVIVTNVVLRYVFGEGRIEFEELQWHLYAVGFLSALGYGVASDDHVRVDFLRARMGLRMQAWIEFYGIALLLFPFVALILVYTVPFVDYSWRTAEVSPAPGGLPYRWLIKGSLFLGFGLLAVAAWSRFCRVSCFLFGAPRALDGDE